MTESSKDIARAGSFGLKLRFRSPRGIYSEDLAALVVEAVRAMGEEVGRRKGALIGHIKVFLTVPEGTLKVNLVDMGLGPEKEDALPKGTVERGEMRFMAAVIGVTDHDVEHLIEESLEPLQRKLEVEVLEHKHEH